MGQNTPQEMGLDVLGIFMHHPGINPGPGWPENGCFWDNAIWKENIMLERRKWTKNTPKQ